MADLANLLMQAKTERLLALVEQLKADKAELEVTAQECEAKATSVEVCACAKPDKLLFSLMQAAAPDGSSSPL